MDQFSLSLQLILIVHVAVWKSFLFHYTAVLESMVSLRSPPRDLTFYCFFQFVVITNFTLMTLVNIIYSLRLTHPMYVCYSDALRYQTVRNLTHSLTQPTEGSNGTVVELSWEPSANAAQYMLLAHYYITVLLSGYPSETFETNLVSSNTLTTF